MTFEELVGEVARAIGLETLVPDEAGVCSLVSEELDLAIRNCPEVGMVLLTAPFAAIEADDPPDVFRKLLAENHLFAGTRGATISVDEEAGTFVLARYFALDTLTGDAFLGRLTGFFETALGLQRRLAEIRGGTSAADSAPGLDYARV